MKEHRDDTKLINDSLVATFQEEMAKDDRPEAKEAYQEIINNLNMVTNQSEVLYQYTSSEMTEAEFIEFLRSHWRNQ